MKKRILILTIFLVLAAIVVGLVNFRSIELLSTETYDINKSQDYSIDDFDNGDRILFTGRPDNLYKIEADNNYIFAINEFGDNVLVATEEDVEFESNFDCIDITDSEFDKLQDAIQILNQPINIEILESNNEIAEQTRGNFHEETRLLQCNLRAEDPLSGIAIGVALQFIMIYVGFVMLFFTIWSREN